MPAANEICKHEGAKVLLVEGPNNCHVVMALCQSYDVPEVFGIYACGSDDLALKRLNALIKRPEPPTVLGVMLDADPSVERRWQAIRSKLDQYPYPFPEQPVVGGTILPASGDAPRLGVWLMPDNRTTGMLEDFCLSMVAPDVRQYVSDTVMSAQGKAGVCTFIPAHYSKAVVHTYLAWQDEPGAPLGQAITRQALQPNTPTAVAFVEWLKMLFIG